VFTARYALSPCIKQIRFVFKGLIYLSGMYPFSTCLREIWSKSLLQETLDMYVFRTDVVTSRLGFWLSYDNFPDLLQLPVLEFVLHLSCYHRISTVWQVFRINPKELKRTSPRRGWQIAAAKKTGWHVTKRPYCSSIAALAGFFRFLHLGFFCEVPLRRSSYQPVAP
jgi:hypothetical protein